MMFLHSSCSVYFRLSQNNISLTPRPSSCRTRNKDEGGDMIQVQASLVWELPCTLLVTPLLTSKCPPLAAFPKVHVFQGQPLALSHFRTFTHQNGFASSVQVIRFCNDVACSLFDALRMSHPELVNRRQVLHLRSLTANTEQRSFLAKPTGETRVADRINCFDIEISS